MPTGKASFKSSLLVGHCWLTRDATLAITKLSKINAEVLPQLACREVEPTVVESTSGHSCPPRVGCGRGKILTAMRTVKRPREVFFCSS